MYSVKAIITTVVVVSMAASVNVLPTQNVPNYIFRTSSQNLIEGEYVEGLYTLRSNEASYQFESREIAETLITAMRIASRNFYILFHLKGMIVSFPQSRLLVTVGDGGEEFITFGAIFGKSPFFAEELTPEGLEVIKPYIGKKLSGVRLTSSIKYFPLKFDVAEISLRDE